MRVASLRAAAAAVCFLTRVPVGRFVRLDASDVARGSVLFPLVGAGVGALAGGLAAVLHPTLPAFVAAAIAVGVATLATGAMHLDALADTFDATSAGSREEALAIMRDPRIGSFGATALALDVLIKVGAIAFLLVTFFHVVLGELFPKTLALQAPDRIALWVARPLNLFITLTRPLALPSIEAYSSQKSS